MTGRQRGQMPADSGDFLAFLGGTLDPINAGVAILDHEAHIIHINDAARLKDGRPASRWSQISSLGGRQSCRPL
ncbi:MAG: hypothetical protein ACYC3S_14425 [Chloroflexota bacterium]